MPRFQSNVILARYSHYRIGGPAKAFFRARSERDLKAAIKAAKAQKMKVFVLGGGTNLLIGDRGFDGLVVKPELMTLTAKGTTVRVGAGVPMADLLRFAMKKSLAGLEWAGGLPGTVGGAIRGNAGCFGGEIKDSVVSVRSLDTRTMKVVTRSRAACRFAYRDSVFKKKDGREIVLDVTLRLAKGDRRAIMDGMSERIVYRERNHPLDYPNIGSTFKNVPLERVHAKGSRAYANAVAHARVRFKGSDFTVKTDPLPVLSAAKLVGESGLRGVSCGGAMISPKHPNFIVNVMDASAADVRALIDLAKAEVRRRFKVQLEEEVQTI
ncbi:MAG TPA: UDP-N-acetylmuramate dehydrogenase [Candidatus Paceibacterota bacterium]|nr:UDP-N-acetylmuramate dehydrogenase [Candidatus Paceibacterota bacterium]